MLRGCPTASSPTAHFLSPSAVSLLAREFLANDTRLDYLGHLAVGFALRNMLKQD
jgi:hypothetical protein